MKFLPYVFILAFGVFFTACGDDCGVGLTAEVSTAAAAFADAQIAYSQDDSEENCIELRNAIDTYLEANAELSSCDGVISAGALGEAQVTQIEDQRADLPCN